MLLFHKIALAISIVLALGLTAKIVVDKLTDTHKPFCYIKGAY